MAVEKAKNVPPFVLWCSATIPTAFDDSMSYYEALCALYKWVQDNIINVVNNNADILKEYVKMVDDLKAYVDNYFENLDVQEEINNKLDEMAEGGQLAGIIAQFLEMSPVFAYGTIAEMAAAENLSNGSIARVLGNTAASDGDGAYYKVRTKGEGETGDGVNKVEIGATLIADRIVNAAAVDLQDQIDELREPVKKYLFVGDSYADGYTPDGDVTAWQAIIKTKLGLDDSQYVTTHQGGFGFGRPAEYNYYTLISALADDSDITDIVIGGGYNDNASTQVDITSGITSVYNLCKTKFPNAKLHIAFIGWSKNAAAKTALQSTYVFYKSGCEAHADIDFMINTEYALHAYFSQFSSDGIHPNLAGQTAIANAIIECLKKGCANITYRTSSIGIDPIEGGAFAGTWAGGSILDNGITTLSFNGNQGTMTFSPAVTLSGKTPLKIGEMNSGVFVGDSTYRCCGMTPAVVQTSDNKYHSLMLFVIVSGGSVYIQNALVNSDGTNYDTMTIKLIQFSSLNITVPSLLA